MATETGYVDAGEAVENSTLSGIKGKAPAVTGGALPTMPLRLEFSTACPASTYPVSVAIKSLLGRS